MEELIIENPNTLIKYGINWEQLKVHIFNVIKTFPKEMQSIKAVDRITVFHPIINQQPGVLQNDRLLHITLESPENLSSTKLKFEATNQFNKITSYNERDQLQKTIETFTVLLKKSIDGTLKASVDKLRSNKNAATSASGLVSLITLV